MTQLLSVRGLTVRFGDAVAVDGIGFDVAAGEVMGLVGESGSGKSATLKALLRLVKPPGRIGGQVLWGGRNLLDLDEAALRQVRGGQIGMIFQEPMTALNPVLPVGLQITEALAEHTSLSAAARRARAVELLDLVGIPAAGTRVGDYPHQFSGGMRQRAMIAIALASEPKLLLADEPTTALDVTIQDQILKLLLRLRRDLGMAIILVTHDLGVVAETCDRVAVMYAGRIVETAAAAALFTRPRHAYSLGLLNSVPSGRERQPLASIPGAPPAITALPAGCAFAPRCAFASDACRAARPPLRELAPGQASACIHHDRLPAPDLAA